MPHTLTRRLSGWAAGVAAILMIPLIAMQFTSEVNWDAADFIVMGVLLFTGALIYELVTRSMTNPTYRAAVAIVCVVIVLLIWADLAVGIFNIPGVSGS